MDETLEKVPSSQEFKYIFGDLPEIFPGVFGAIVERGNYIFINVIWSATENKGNVGRYLDSLPKDKIIIFPSVVSKKLEGMLLRRGYINNRGSDQWIRKF
jgi:hypothetical protein